MNYYGWEAIQNSQILNDIENKIVVKPPKISIKKNKYKKTKKSKIKKRKNLYEKQLFSCFFIDLNVKTCYFIIVQKIKREKKESAEK